MDGNEKDSVDRIEGRNPVLEALKAGRGINRILVARGEKHGSIREILARAREAGIPIQEVDRPRIDALAHTRGHQGVIALAAPRAYADLGDLLAAAAGAGEPALLVALDGVEDPMNLGSLLRSADAAGAHGVIIPERRAAALTPAAVKAAAGAAEYVPVARVTNLARALAEIKDSGIWVVGADSRARQTLYEADLTGPVTLVVGGEGKGLGRLVAETCDYLVRIPMGGRISSLNAAVAGAILLFEARRQRQGAGERRPRQP